MSFPSMILLIFYCCFNFGVSWTLEGAGVDLRWTGHLGISLLCIPLSLVAVRFVLGDD